jgi:hypothetical protein
MFYALVSENRNTLHKQRPWGSAPNPTRGLVPLTPFKFKGCRGTGSPAGYFGEGGAQGLDYIYNKRIPMR